MFTYNKIIKMQSSPILLTNQILLGHKDYNSIQLDDLNMTVFLKVVHIDQNDVIKALSLKEIQPYLSIKTIVNGD
jgi:hypothetical protein